MNKCHSVRSDQIKETIKPEAAISVALGISIVNIVRLEEIENSIWDSK